VRTLLCFLLLSGTVFAEKLLHIPEDAITIDQVFELPGDRQTLHLPPIEADKRNFVLFPVHNSTDRDIEFEKIGTSCGCTTALPQSRIIKAGEKSSFVVILNRGRGDLNSLLTVHVKNQPETKISLNTQVLERFSTSDVLEFGDSLVVRDNFDKEKEPVEVSCPEFTAKLSSQQPGKFVYRLDFDDSFGKRPEQVVLVTLKRGNHEVRQTLVVRNSKALAIKPTILMFSERDGRMVTRCMFSGDHKLVKPIVDTGTIKVGTADARIKGLKKSSRISIVELSISLEQFSKLGDVAELTVGDQSFGQVSIGE